MTDISIECTLTDAIVTVEWRSDDGLNILTEVCPILDAANGAIEIPLPPYAAATGQVRIAQHGTDEAGPTILVVTR